MTEYRPTYLETFDTTQDAYQDNSTLFNQSLNDRYTTPTIDIWQELVEARRRIVGDCYVL